MIKHYKKMLTVLMLLIASSSVFAQHDAGDIAALQNIIANNFSSTTQLNWGTESDPDLWDGVTWDASSPKRVIMLELANTTANNNATGLITDLQGSIDFTGLDAIQSLYVQRNQNISSINISGLAFLDEFLGAHTNATSVNASNCPLLTNIRMKESAELTSINFTGSTGLEMVKLPRSPKLTSINVASRPNLLELHARGNSLMTSVSVSNCPSLTRLSVRESALTSLDVTGNTSLDRIRAYECKLTDITGLLALNNLTQVRIYSNEIPFDKAVQFYAKFIGLGGNFDISNQPLIPGVTIANGGTANFSSLASIIVSGSPVATSFDLYDATTNTLVSSNTTGLFTISTDGGYYITATNSGYSRNSGPIIVGAGVTIDPSFSNADYAILMGFKANNFGANSFNWGGVSDLTQMTGVTWDNGTPRRVTQLNLSVIGKNYGSTVPITISGTMDFSGLTMLYRLYMLGHSGVTAINVAGLNNLYELFVSHTGITSLDASDLAALYEVRISGGVVNSVDISNTPTMFKLRVKKTPSFTSALNITSSDLRELALSGTGFTSYDASGNTTLEKIGFSETPITSLNVSNCTNLRTVATKKSINFSSLNVSGCTALSEIRVGGCNLTSLDVTGLTNINQIGAGKNKLTNITGAIALTSINTFRVRNNKMLLSIAAPLSNLPSVTTRRFDNQSPYSDIVVDINDNVDYSNQASITINGTPVTSTFNLYDITNTLISTNTTGIFTMSTLGDYYVEMTNSGVTVRTGNIAVIDVATQPVISASLDNSDFGATSVGASVTRTLTINNTGGATLTVSNIIMPSGFTLTGSVTTIAANSSATLTVTFTPSTVMTYNGNILVISDAAAGSGQVSVTGVGSPVSGVYTKKESFLSFYPNPTSDKMLVKQTNTNANVLYIYSMEGVLVQMVDLGQSSIVDVQALPKGVYVVKSEDGTITERFVKL